MKISIYLDSETFGTLQMFRKSNETVSAAISRAIREAEENKMAQIISERLVNLFGERKDFRGPVQIHLPPHLADGLPPQPVRHPASKFFFQPVAPAHGAFIAQATDSNRLNSEKGGGVLEAEADM